VGVISSCLGEMLNKYLIPNNSGSNWPFFELSGDKSTRPAAILDSYVLPIVRQAFSEQAMVPPQSAPSADDATLVRETKGSSM
jgi:hypothetical protein